MNDSLTFCVEKLIKTCSLGTIYLDEKKCTVCNFYICKLIYSSYDHTVNYSLKWKFSKWWLHFSYPEMKKSYICFCSVNGRARNLYIFQKMNHGIYICVELVLFSLLMIIVQVVCGCFYFFYFFVLLKKCFTLIPNHLFLFLYPSRVSQ